MQTATNLWNLKIFGVSPLLSLCALVLVLMYVWARANVEDTKANIDSDDDSRNLQEEVAQFRLSASDLNEYARRSTRLLFRLKHNPVERQVAVSERVISYILQSIYSNGTLDRQRAVIAIDLVNLILNDETVSKLLVEDNSLLRDTADGLLTVIKELLLQSQDDAEFPGNLDGNAYKFILAIGLICRDMELSQSCIADRGGLDIVCATLRLYFSVGNMGKWCCWTLTNLVHDHPSNIAQFTKKGGIPLLIKTLDANPDDIDLHKQGLALIFYVLSDHAFCSYSLKEARTSAVMSGVVSTIQRAQRSFKDIPDIKNPCNCILNILVHELS